MNIASKTPRVSARTAVLVGAATALAVAAAFVSYRSRKAERDNPPQGSFVEVDGIRLHYLERGDGPVLVLLHGNGSLVQDFELSGLIDLAAQRYRVLAFDRPGYGYSDSLPHRPWDAVSQADLIFKALQKLGVHKPIVLGHSWGTLVTLAMALEHQDELSGIVLLSGYYYPSLRMDVALMAAPAVPVVGTLMRHTVSPLISSAAWTPIQKRLFAPEDIPPRFAGFPKWLSLRPSQLRVSSAEVAMMMTEASRLSRRAEDLHLPVFVMAGADDKHVSAHWHSEQFADTLKNAELKLVPKVGHMLHHFVPLEVLTAVDSVRERATGKSLNELSAAHSTPENRPFAL